MMKILVHSEISAATIARSLGLPDYSYYFVLKEFLPVLRELGDVVVVEAPGREVDALYDQAISDGESCVFLSFTPPHKTPLELRCPTFPVFAWEFDSIPSEPWLEEEQQNWAVVLKRCGAAITHSELTVRAVRDLLGQEFPVLSIPAPVWDKYEGLRSTATAGQVQHRPLRIARGVVLDSHDVSLAPYMPGIDAVQRAVTAARGASAGTTSAPNPRSPLRITLDYLGQWYRQVLLGREPAAPAPDGQAKRLEPENPVEPQGLPPVGGESYEMPVLKLAEHSLQLSGVVFTALFNPYDGRKNWVDMLTAFCAAFRDQPNATLLFKLGHHEYQSAMNDMLMCMARMPAFRCRVVLLQGFLEGNDFESLIRGTAFVVNASHGEGQCLPLMEFLSCGKPAVAPRHSAMADYIDERVAFVVDSWLDATAWPHDPRLAYRTLRHQVDWQSLVAAYRAAYTCYAERPELYARMSADAIERMRGHCSREAARRKLETFLEREALEA
ncbi:glycosyltransferase [Pseudomonas aeruginosa]|nr:glycosyltransferase [Pseudomonas aeruginosa]HBO7421172.1 glycosyltransferase [Pseudomonas aeruginosa]